MTRVAHCLWHHGNFIWFWFAHLSAYGHLTETIKYLSWLEQSSCCATCHSNRCSLHNLIGTPCVVFHWNYFCLWACSESLWHKLSITLETFEYCELEHFISSHSLLHTHYPAGIITFWPYSQNVAAQTKTGNVSPHLLLSSFLRSVFNHSLSFQELHMICSSAACLLQLIVHSES